MTLFTVTFASNGIGNCLYTEQIDLSTLGTLEISRATTIEFNQPQQLWEVRNNKGELIYQHASRNTCLLWEQQHFNSDHPLGMVTTETIIPIS